MNPAIHLDAYIDLTCPYCFLGKRQLEKALANAQTPVSVSWQSLQLTPDTPSEGKPYHRRMTEIIGSESRKNEALAGITRAGAAVGIEFRFDRVEKMPNTLLAHCLIRWSEPGNEQSKMVETLLRAYFTEGQFIGDPTVLSAIARDVTGTDQLSSKLLDQTAVDAVRQEISSNQQLGLGGVPAFVFNRQYLLSGAQDASQFNQLIDRLAQA